MKRVIFLASLIFALALSNVFAMEKLWYLTDTKRSVDSFIKNYSKVDVIAPQTYYLKKDGVVSGSVPEKVGNVARNRKIKIIALLANTNGKSFNRAVAHDLVGNPKNWENVAKFMREEAYARNLSGWQLDLENIDLAYSKQFTDMVKYLKGELDKDQLTLSVAVVARISDDKKDYEANYWKYWAGVYNYKELAPYVDFLSVMIYDEPNTEGPVASLEWSKKVIEYSIKNVPQEKLSLGIPVYGAAYRGEEQNRFTMVDFPFTNKILTDFNKRDSKNMTTGAGTDNELKIPWVTYTRYGKNYKIWYENKNTFKDKLDQINKLAPGARGFSVWVIGDEDSKVWSLF